MPILMKNREDLLNDDVDYKYQSDFMEIIKLAIRGDTKPEDMLIQTKYFTIITLK